MVYLDTDILVNLLRGEKSAIEAIEKLEDKGERIREFDSIIGSIILNHNDFLVTRNQKHFDKIPDLEVKRW